MALTRRFGSAKSKNVRWNPSSSLREGCDRDQHLLIGTTSSPPNSLAHRAMIEFDHDWTGMAQIVKVELFIKTETSSTHYTYGTAPRVRVNRATEEFSSVTSSEDTWTAAMYEGISSWGGVDVEADIPLNTSGLPQDEYWLSLDITGLMEYFAPTSVVMPNGHPGGGGTNNGFVLLAPGDETITKQRSIFWSRYAPDPNNYPYILVTYDQPNQPPTAPTLTAPPQGNNNLSEFFEGDHHDPDGDPMGGRYINVYPKGGATPLWSLSGTAVNAGYGEVQTGHFSVPLSLLTGVLKLQTDYEWEAATKDNKGRVGPFSSPRRSLRLTSSPPRFTLREWDTISAAELPVVSFGGWAVDDDGNPVTYFHLQMQPKTAWADGSWLDPSLMVWDTGEIPTTVQEQDQPTVSKVIVRQYAGRPIVAGEYSWRVRVKDSTGSYSQWVYDDFVLTGTPDIEPGQGDDAGTITDRASPVRVALYKMGTARAPGALIGYVDDPIHLGASAFLNGGGELYFSLPALHPYCPDIEPHRTHYQVQQYYGDRYRPLFAGIITDFDADADSVVFYGTDYLGLLATAVDERFTGKPEGPVDSEDPASGTGGGGSKYSDKTIDWVINDQLLYHKGRPNSPVGFITVGTLSALAEHVTIYSTYSEALPFITGLMDSHKQGTGREARFYARPKDSTWMSWEWALADPWGKDRPNIRLEYGSLINDFRVVALGDFATRVVGIGTKRGQVEVVRATGASGLDEAQWGRRARVVYHADIVDLNDLTRRVQEQATQMAKVGKRVALAIKADSLAPFDGWDIGDNILIDIKRGVVDTSRYGSGGYWTIYGVEWRYEPDGHSDLTLTLLPKKTLTPPNPDLIPSAPPVFSREWQVGYGVPYTYGEPPSRTPVAGAFMSNRATARDVPEELPLSTDPITALHYEDLNTGCVYELDTHTGDYEEVFCPATEADLLPLVDTVPPDSPVIKSLVTSSTQQNDGTVITSVVATVGYASPPAGLTDLDSYVLEVTRSTLSSGLPDWTLATTWVGPAADRVGAINTVITLTGLMPVTAYWLRAYAVDKIGNRSIPSATSTITSAGDAQGPPLPSGVVMSSGHATIGLRWDPVNALDLAYVEVQWRISPAGNWVSVRVPGTMTVITGLTNDTAYEVRLRSVDTSGNVQRATGGHDPSGNPIYETVKVAGDPNAGWVSAGTATPSALSGNSLVWDEAMIEDVFAGNINADWITAGTLKVGGSPGTAAAIEVYDALGRLIGQWSTDGIEVLDPTNPGYRLIIDEATLTIWSGYDTAQPFRAVSLTPLGIDAASITFGSARGGHNLIQNSSFELGRLGVAATTYHTWTDPADWNATRLGTDTNISTGVSELVMTAI